MKNKQNLNMHRFHSTKNIPDTREPGDTLSRAVKKFTTMCVKTMQNIEELSNSPEGLSTLAQSGRPINETKILLFRNKLPFIFKKSNILDADIQTELLKAIPILYDKVLKHALKQPATDKPAMFRDALNAFVENIQSNYEQHSQDLLGFNR